MTTPKFKHDCGKCQFLGIFSGHDLYICGARMTPGLGPTILARFGNDGPEYASMPWGIIEATVDHGPIPEPIMAGVQAVEEIMADTLRVRSADFRQFLHSHGTPRLLESITRHANKCLREELTAQWFPYDPTPFLALHAIAHIQDGTVNFGITATSLGV